MKGFCDLAQRLRANVDPTQPLDPMRLLIGAPGTPAASVACPPPPRVEMEFEFGFFVVIKEIARKNSFNLTRNMAISGLHPLVRNTVVSLEDGSRTQGHAVELETRLNWEAGLSVSLATNLEEKVE